MPVEKIEKKVIELWPGKEIEVVREELLRDIDYITDLQKQLKENDLGVIHTLFVLIGGEPVLDEFRQHVVAEKGVFDYEEVGKVTKKLLDLLPKAPSSSSKRW